MKEIIIATAIILSPYIGNASTSNPVHVWTKVNVTQGFTPSVYFNTPKRNVAFVTHTTPPVKLPYSTWINGLSDFGVEILIDKFKIQHEIDVRLGKGTDSPECQFIFDPQGPGQPGVTKKKLHGATKCTYDYKISKSGIITQYLNVFDSNYAN